MKICISSTNPHKIGEIRGIIDTSFPHLNLELDSIQNMNIPEPNEPYTTFMENARHKAQYYAEFTKQATLSEDSGLCIEALDGFPGVYTKDFCLECGDITTAYATLEKMLSGKTDYNAYFACAAVLYLPAKKEFINYEARVTGKISFPARGDKGFAFDPIFIPHGYDQTMAELGPEVKNLIGHRASAIKGVLEECQQRL